MTIDPEIEPELLRSRTLVEAARKESETLRAQIRSSEETIARSREQLARLDELLSQSMIPRRARPTRRWATPLRRASLEAGEQPKFAASDCRVIAGDGVVWRSG
jgi:multidrug resistance efflux pump